VHVARNGVSQRTACASGEIQSVLHVVNSCPLTKSDGGILHVSLRFNGNFPGGSRLAGTRMSPFLILLELRVKAEVVRTGTTRRAKLQSE